MAKEKRRRRLTPAQAANLRPFRGKSPEEIEAALRAGEADEAGEAGEVRDLMRFVRVAPQVALPKVQALVRLRRRLRDGAATLSYREVRELSLSLSTLETDLGLTDKVKPRAPDRDHLEFLRGAALAEAYLAFNAETQALQDRELDLRRLRMLPEEALEALGPGALDGQDERDAEAAAVRAELDGRAREDLPRLFRDAFEALLAREGIDRDAVLGKYLEWEPRAGRPVDGRPTPSVDGPPGAEGGDPEP